MNSASLAAWSAALFLGSTLFSHTVALRLTLLGLGALLCAVTVVRYRSEVSAVPPIWLPFLLWAAWSAASLSWSVEPDRSEKELQNEVVYTGIALWTCYVAAQARDAARILLPVLAALAALLCGMALYLFQQPLETYVNGLHGGPGALSTTLITLLPCVVVAAWYGGREGSRCLLLGGLAFIPLLLAAAYTTLNRTVWIAFGVQLMLVGTLIALRNGLPGTARGRQIAATFVIGVLAATAFATVHMQQQRVAMGARDVSHDPRLRLWPEVIRHIEARPLTGYGFGSGLLRKSLNEELHDSLLWHAHNIFLDMALQLGLPGAVLFILLLAATLREGWRLARTPDLRAAACGVALLAVLAGMMLRNSTDTLLGRQNALLYWGVVGVLLAWGRQALEQAGARNRPTA